MTIGFGQKAAKPDVRVFAEPATNRSIVEWSPSLVRAARLSADSGHLDLAADFCEWAMADDRVSSALTTRTNGLTSLPITFDAARGAKRAVKALEVGEDWWKAYPAETIAQLLAWGRLLGVSCAQQIWVDRGDGIGRLIPKLEFWHPRNLRWDPMRKSWQVRDASYHWFDITPGDGQWILFTPYGPYRPWVQGAWRAISYWRLLKQYAIEDWGYHSNKQAGGILVASPTENVKGVDKEKRKELAADLFALMANGSLVLPPGFTLDLVESEANTYQTFVAQKDAADLATCVTLLGQNLSSEVSGPVATGATLHGKVLQVYIDDDNEKLHTCLHDQSVVYWAELNFGSRTVAPWTSYDTKPPEDRKANADVLKTVADAVNTLINANAPIDTRTLLDKLGVPLKDEKDIEQTGQVFKYHLDYGILTINEIRERLGLPKIAGGDEPPKPMLPLSSAPADEKSLLKRLGVFTEEELRAAVGSVSLRSGEKVSKASGLVQGQLYTDTVADVVRDRAKEILAEDLDAVIEALEGASSYDDVRTRLAKVFKGMSPEKLAAMTEASLLMTGLGGRHAINEDT